MGTSAGRSAFHGPERRLLELVTSAASDADAARIAVLRTAVAERLTRDHGRGHWSSAVSEKSVLRSIRTSRVLAARLDGVIVGTLSLGSKKPWAIDLSYFTRVQKTLYLADMAVDPELQLQGIGRRLLDEARAVVRAFPAEAIRLDAYDGPAGAGRFYARCGFREVGRVTYRGIPLVYFEDVL